MRMDRLGRYHVSQGRDIGDGPKCRQGKYASTGRNGVVEDGRESRSGLSVCPLKVTGGRWDLSLDRCGSDEGGHEEGAAAGVV